MRTGQIWLAGALASFIAANLTEGANTVVLLFQGFVWIMVAVFWPAKGEGM